MPEDALPPGDPAPPEERRRRRARARRQGAPTGEADPTSAAASNQRRNGPEPLLRQSVIAEPLRDMEQLKEMGLLGKDGDEHTPIQTIVELNVRYESGVRGAAEQARSLYREVVRRHRQWTIVSDIYAHCLLSVAQVRELVRRDAYEGSGDSRRHKPPGQRAIFRVWPDFPIEPLIYRSVATVKADAARRSFGAIGRDIVWAVIDSGIDAKHPHFQQFDTLGGDVAGLHMDFTRSDGNATSALTDADGHGTHVAGIIAGALPKEYPFKVYEEVKASDDTDTDPTSRIEDHTDQVDSEWLAGIAPRCKLVSLKVFDPPNFAGSSMTIVRALEYIRRDVNGSSSKLPRIHGVNLSVGYPFLAEWFACGASPLCDEVNRLVRSGVVVVVAAGNIGYGFLTLQQKKQSRAGLSLTIMDPGNADLAITVGSTHRDMPHTYGVSYFSSKGPTGDGRLKPDLVAPGERITSCAAGEKLTPVGNLASRELRDGSYATGYYIDSSGTSMAAPHVSGTVAAFLSIRREYIGQPSAVKGIFLNSATSLGREHYFEGRGLVDLMRAIQAV